MNTLYRSKMLNRVMFILSIVGIIIAFYVTQSFLRGTPIVCVNSGCELVRKNPASYIAGIPVPMFGLIGYSLLFIIAFLRTTSEKLSKTLLPFIVAIATGGVLFVSWFTFTEITVIHGLCTWCGVSGINMLVIFITSVISFKIERKSI